MLKSSSEHFALENEYRVGLSWFVAHTGEEIAWPQPLGNLHLVNRAKGIHKPAGWEHALSIRQTLGAPYQDRDVVELPDGSWSFEYSQEGTDSAKRDQLFTNRALMRNMTDGIPVAVLRQLKSGRHTSYRVQGIAEVVGCSEGYFQFRSVQFDRRVEATLSSQATLPLDLTDARRRTEASIVARQGAGIFRSRALAAFNNQCAVSGCDVVATLEAAHIVPYLGPHTNTLANTLLLRADLHTLLDRDLMDIDPETFCIRLDPKLADTSYAYLDGRKLNLPKNSNRWSNAFAQRRALKSNGSF